ncbi:MAG: hypothetical protein ACSLFK_14345 [Gemmatimonadaceae bacterium]
MPSPRLLLLATLLIGCAPRPTEPVAPTPVPEQAIPSGPYTPGESYFGRDDYIEYIAGNAPVIFTAPHGGSLNPAGIPDRTPAACGGTATINTDLNTAELARSMQQRYFAKFGKYPHVVIMHLARRKLDANRTDPEASCGNAAAGATLAQWHAFIDAAKNVALASSPKAWYMDVHGHRHAIDRLELGYLLTRAQLDLSDDSLNAGATYEDIASVTTLSRAAPASFSELLRGPNSLGTIYAAGGFRSIPSSADPRPAGEAYFSGGDNTRRHTCGAEATPFGGVSGGNVCGVQLEANFTGVRDNAVNRDRFGDVTATVLQQFLLNHWGLVLGPQ